MSYSRRQLYAFGEPLGNSVTRKEGGRVVYGDGGGSSQPTSQTSVSELPEWAKGYAKDTLSKAGALTDINQNPYKPYEGSRIAGFSPLQQQAQQQAAGMQTSGLTGLGGQLAGAATMGALGTKYDPSSFQAGFTPTEFQGGQFGQQDAQQYMSPYMQSVVDIQQREAQRQGDIAGTQRNAQAVRSGAFGGSRQAIMDAEAARNLATQKGDIQAQGLQSAYQQAQSQFNADQARRMQAQQFGEQSRQFGSNLGMQAQQLGEQSKQYGAGLGLQGLQTALQGAGQMGTLGGQQFAQGMDINKLQNAYGGQQQALQQQGLSQAYQDFQNQQNYPYKQLGFMSDMIRGLPLGQQSTSQIYEAPGSMTGQIAGLGTGLYGLSKFMAEGGSVNSYADGGSVDSQQNVANIVRQLSNEQLKQALQAAQARADMDQIEAIQREMAERASMSKGLASVPMDYEAMMPDESVGMANGGIVAFAGPEEDNNFSLVTDPQFGGSSVGAEVTDARPKPSKGEVAAILEELRAAKKNVGLSTILDIESGKITSSKKSTAPAPRLAAVKAEEKKAAPPPEIKAEVKKATSPAAISKSVDKIAEETGVPKQTLMEQFDEIQKKFSSNNAATNDILKKAEEKLAGRAEEIKGKGLGEALMAFGFNMAAEASKPGGKFLKAAAAASPTLGKAAMDNKKLQMAAEDNLAKMQIDRAKYDQAMQKQDTASATQLLAQIRQGEYQDAALKEQIAQNARANALAREQMGITAAYQNRVGVPEVFRIADQLKARGFKGTDEQLMAEAERLKNSGITERAEQASLGRIAGEVQKALEKNIEYTNYNIQLLNPKLGEGERASIMSKMQEIEQRAEAAIRSRKGMSGQAGSVAPPQNLAKLGYQLVE